MKVSQAEEAKGARQESESKGVPTLFNFLTNILRPDGKTIHFDYDTAGRLDTTTIARGSYAYSYSESTGQLETITAPDGNTLSYTYDGSLLLTSTWSGDVSGTVTRTYDSDFKITSLSLRGAEGDVAISFSYDDDGLDLLPKN